MERFAKTAGKIKKFLYFLIFGEMKLSSSNIKKFMIFSQKKAFLRFRETKTLNKFLMFQKKETLKNLYISESNFLDSRNEKTHSEKTSYILRNEPFLYFKR